MASLGPISPGDIVEVDRKGRRFFAKVLEKEPGMLSRIQPLDTRITYTTAKASEVVAHYRKSKNARQATV
jgi:DNA-directed RNA polymerase subunit H (RpoH/RPB5)